MSPPAAPIGAVVLVAAYLLGSLPIAWLLGRRRNLELRGVGSGNPGTSNLFRNAGFGPAAVSGPLQFAQGLAAVLIARAVGGGTAFIGAAAICVVVGNGWPVWLGFNGQRGVAVATGAAAALSPWLLGVLLVCFGAGALLRAIAAGVLAGFAALPVAAAWLGGRDLALACCGLLLAVVLRRLQGVRADLRGVEAGGAGHLLARRLIMDERPGQVLVGPRGAPAAVEHPRT